MIDVAVMGEGALADAIRAARLRVEGEGPTADANANAGAGADPGALVIVADPAVTADQAIRMIRDSAAAAVLVVALPGFDLLEHRLLGASIAPLAIERAPGGRLCMITVMPGAALEDVIESASYLLSANAITGQIIAVQPRGAPPCGQADPAF